MDFSQVSLLVVTAAGFGLLAKVLKQPLIIGYLFAGLFLSISGLLVETPALESMGQIGVALLLFLLGLEMKLAELSNIGKPALLTGLGQIVFTSGIGFLIAKALGFATLSSVYIAVALTFSSTIIMVKLLSEKKELGSLYGKIAIGFLLVQDFVAVAILMFLSSIGRGGASLTDYGIILTKAVLLFAAIWFLSKKVLPKAFDNIAADSGELLHIASLAWALGVAAFVAGPLGFTLEIGGFLAGISLSNLPEHLQIASKTRPLRDFFLVIFFLTLGAKLVIPGGILAVLVPALIFSAFVLIGNPVIVLVLMGVLGYRKRTSFLAGLTVAQISEFSLILMAMGLSINQVGQEEVSIILLVGIITMTASTYVIMSGDGIYRKLSSYLSVFEKKKTKERAFIKETDLKDHVVLVGADRTGNALVRFLKNKGWEFLVVDFNPSVFSKLTAKKVDVIFGDINDPEILEAANIKNASMVIMTPTQLGTNMLLLEYIKDFKNKPSTIFSVSRRSDAIKLYEKGADYVIVPEVVAGDYLIHLLKTYGTKGKRLSEVGKSHFDKLIFK